MNLPHFLADPHSCFASRRDFLRRTGSGMGLLALSGLLQEAGLLSSSAHGAIEPINPLAPKPAALSREGKISGSGSS